MIGYYEIIGSRTGRVLGVCSNEEDSIIRAIQEDGAHLFGEITAEQAQAYGATPWDRPISTRRWDARIKTSAVMTPMGFSPRAGALLPGDKSNFDTLRKAGKRHELFIATAIRKSDNKQVALVCAANRDPHRPGEIGMAPLAVMIEGNPFEDFYDPSESQI